MKAWRFILALGLVFLAAVPSWALAQADGIDLKAGYFSMAQIGEADLAKEMVHKGQFIEGVNWKDEGGSNFLLLCYDTPSGTQQGDIYVYQYRAVGGKISLVWDIQDFGSAACAMRFVNHSLQLVDLDQDGLLECCFMYQNECEGPAPRVTKLMLMKNGQKLAIRGTFSAENEAELEKTFDPVVAQYSAIFKNFMLMNWNEFKRGEFEYSKSIRYKTDEFIVLEKEYLMASGGTEYQILELNGLPMPIARGMEDKIREPVSLQLMPDRKHLIYCSLKGVGIYDPISKVEQSFMTFFDDTEAVSGIVWSPDKRKVAFTALNRTQYPQATKVFVLTLDGNNVVKKDKYDAKLFYMAASDWVVDAPRWRDNATLEFTEMVIKKGEPTEGGLKTIVVQ